MLDCFIIFIAPYLVEFVHLFILSCPKIIADYEKSKLLTIWSSCYILNFTHFILFLIQLLSPS
jgi:hypothetical protein